jgi:hypothetical protein
MKNFKELRIWQKGIDIAVKSYELFQFHEILLKEAVAGPTKIISV